MTASPDTSAAAAAAEQQANNVVLATRGLSKSFGDVHAVADLDLELERGEVFGFLGPNGAGKSTTINLILGMLRPTRGAATVFGHDTQTDGLNARSKIGFLPGDYRADRRITGWSLLGLVSQLRGTGIPDYAHELVDMFDAEPAKTMGDLSSGNRQKIGLIAALMHQSPLLVLDEPTTGLDPLMQAAFGECVNACRDNGQTVLLSSHNLTEVEHLCDRAGIIRQGRLVTLETIADLRRRQFLIASVRFASAVSVDELVAIDGVKCEASGEQTAVELELHGNVAAVLSTLGAMPVDDIEVQRSSLEDIFLAHYAGSDEVSS